MNTMQTRTSQPHFYDEESMGAWDRVKEAFRRDWEQTKHDLGLSGGHELNQSALDTIKQATAAESIPADDRPNPPKVIGAWDEAEYPIGYGYTARRKYGLAHPKWNEDLDRRFCADWEAHTRRAEHEWDRVSRLVRFGYEHQPRH